MDLTNCLNCMQVECCHLKNIKNMSTHLETRPKSLCQCTPHQDVHPFAARQHLLPLGAMLLELLILQQLAIQAFSDESFVKADGSLAICWTHCKSMVVANWGRRAPNHRTIRCATFHWTPGSINVQKRHHHIHRGHEEPSELEQLGGRTKPARWE